MNPETATTALEQIRGAVEHGDMDHARELRNILMKQVLVEVAGNPGQYISNKRMAETCVLADELINNGGALMKAWYKIHGRVPTLLEWRDFKHAQALADREREQNEVVGYTLGSFWYCEKHQPEGSLPARRGDLMKDHYNYNCDQCGVKLG